MGVDVGIEWCSICYMGRVWLWVLARMELGRDIWSRWDPFLGSLGVQEDSWSDIIDIWLYLVSRFDVVIVLGVPRPYRVRLAVLVRLVEPMSWPSGLSFESLWLTVLAETQVGRLARVWRGKPNHIICFLDVLLLLFLLWLLLLLLWHYFWTEAFGWVETLCGLDMVYLWFGLWSCVDECGFGDRLWDGQLDDGDRLVGCRSRTLML